MKKNRPILLFFLGLMLVLALGVYLLPQTSFGRGFILSQLSSVLAEQGYDLTYQQSSGNLWRQLELSQTSLTTQGATLQFDTIGLNYSLRKLLVGEKPLNINLKGVDGDVFLAELLNGQKTNSSIITNYIEDLSIEEISLKLQDLPYDLPEFNLSNLELLAFESTNTHVLGDLSTSEGSAKLAVIVESTEPFKARLDIIEADAVLAKHWTQRLKAGKVSGQFEITANEVSGDFNLVDSHVNVADIDITNVDGQFNLANNQISGQATGIAFDSLAQGDLQLNLKQEQWQSHVTSTTNLTEASAWIFRKSPQVHDYLKLSGSAPIELELSGWQKVELVGKAIVPEGLSMMGEDLKNVQADIYFANGNGTDVTLTADYQAGQMEYIRIAADKETKLAIRDMRLVEDANQKAVLDADVVFSTGENGLKYLRGPLVVDYSLTTNGQEENFKADILSKIKEDNWDFDVALTDAYGNAVDGDVTVSSSETTLALTSESLDLEYLEKIFQNSIISKLNAEQVQFDAVTTGLTLQERLTLNSIESIRSLISQAKQASLETDALSFISEGQEFSASSLNADLDIQTTKLDLIAADLKLPFEVVKDNPLQVLLSTAGDVFNLDVKANESVTDLVDAKELRVEGRLSEATKLTIEEMNLAGLSANGELVFAEPLNLASLASVAEVAAGARGSLAYTLSETPIVVEGLSNNALEVAGVGKLELGERLESQAELDIKGIEVLGLPETMQAELTWQQNGALSIVDSQSGLSLSRRLVPVANSLSIFGEASLQDTIAVSEIVLENTPIELLGQSYSATGRVTLLPNSEPSIDAILQATDYQIKAKGTLNALALELNLPAGTDLLNSDALVTAQELMFQGTLNVPAKQLALNAPLGTSLSGNLSSNSVAIAAQWFENDKQVLESINLELKQSDLVATTTINDVSNLDEVLKSLVVSVSGQGKIDDLAALFAYDVSGNVTIGEIPVQVSFSPLEVKGDASFAGEIQEQDIQADIQAQGTRLIGNVKTSLLGQEQLLSGELYPSLALTTTFPYLGDVVLSGTANSLQISGEGVLDVNELIAQASTSEQLSGLASDLYIAPQTWQLTGGVATQQLNLKVGESSFAQFDWTEQVSQSGQNIQWNLVANIEQQGTWKDLPVGFSGSVQHSSNQEAEVVDGNLSISTIPISFKGNREEINFSSQTQVKDILAVELLDSGIKNLLLSVAQEMIALNGSIVLADELVTYDVSGQLSNESPLQFVVSNQTGANKLRVEGSTDVLSRVDWVQQWPSVGWAVGSSLKTASAISLETEFHSNINELSVLTINLDGGTTIATVPLDGTTPLNVKSTVAWLKHWSEQVLVEQPTLNQGSLNSSQLQSAVDIVSTLFTDGEVVELESDSNNQNLIVSIGEEPTDTVVLTISNLNNDVVEFDTQIPATRLATWQSQGLFAQQSVVPQSLISYLTRSDGLELSGNYNQTTQAVTGTLKNNFLALNVVADLQRSQAIDFKLDSSVAVLTAFLESSALDSFEVSGADNQSPINLDTVKKILSVYAANDALLLEGRYLLSGQYDAQVNITQQTSESQINELTDISVSKTGTDDVSFQLDLPVSIISQPEVQALLPSAIRTIAPQLSLRDKVSATGVYNLNSKTVQVDALLKHTDNSNSVVKIVSDDAKHLTLQVDAPAFIAVNLLSQSAQVPLQLTEFVTQQATQARLVAQGNYNLEKQSYNLDFSLNQLNQETIPFTVSNIGDGVLNFNVNASAVKVVQLIEQSNVLSAVPVSVNTLIRQFLSQTIGDAIKLQGSYSQLQQSYTFFADMANAQQMMSRVAVQGTAVDGIELVIDTQSSVLGGLELSQLPLNTDISSLLTRYLQSPNTQAIQLKTKLDTTSFNSLDVTVNHPNIEPSTISITLQDNGKLDTITANSPMFIVKELVASQSILPANNQYLNTILDDLLQNNAERITLGYQALSNEAYQLSGLSKDLEVTVTSDNQIQSPLQIQLKLPTQIVRQLTIKEPSLNVVNDWLQAVPLQDVVTVNGNFYPYNQSFQLSSSLEHGSDLASELSVDNLQGQTQFKLSTPVNYIPQDISTQLKLPANLGSVLSEWLKGSHNLSSSLELEGVLQTQGFKVDVGMSHNGFVATTLALEQTPDNLSFVLDTPSQPLTNLPITTLLDIKQLIAYEADIDTLLTRGDRLKLSGQVMSQSADFDIDAALLNLNSDVLAAELNYSSGEYSLRSSPRRDVFEQFVSEQIYTYLPDVLDVDLSWQDIEQISIRARAKQTAMTNPIDLQGILSNRTNLQFSTVLDAATLQNSVSDFTNVTSLDYLNLEQFTSTQVSGSFNIPNRQYTVDALLNSQVAVSTLRLQGDVNSTTFSGEVNPELLELTNQPVLEYVNLNQLSAIAFSGVYDFLSRNYNSDITLSGLVGGSSFNVQGDSNQLAFSGLLNPQLLNLLAISPEVQTELSTLSALPIQGRYTFANGGSYQASTQLETIEGLTASITDGRVNLQLAGLLVERIPVAGADASWVARFEDFDPRQLQTLSIYQQALANASIANNLLDSLRLNGVLRLDGNVWQGEVLASTGRPDISDLRISGQGESLYLQTIVSQFGQSLELAGSVFPSLALQVQGDYLDALGTSRGRFEGQLSNWQQPMLNGVIRSAIWQRDGLLLPIQEARLQASVADLSRWQDSLSFELTSMESDKPENILKYQDSLLEGNWVLPITYNGESYGVTLKPEFNSSITNIQSQNLTLDADIDGRLFSAKLREVNFNQLDVISSNISLQPKPIAFASIPVESLQTTNSEVTGSLNYNLNDNRLELRGALQPYNQNASLNVVSELGQLSASLDFLSFVPNAVPELRALTLSNALQNYLGLNNPTNLKINLAGTDLRFESNSELVALNGQLAGDAIDVTLTHNEGNLRLTGTSLDALQVSLNIPEFERVLATNNVPTQNLSNYIEGSLVFNGVADLIEGISLEGTTRLGDYEVQTQYVQDGIASTQNIKLSTIIDDKTIALNAANTLNTPESWQVQFEYDDIQVTGTVANQVDAITWQLQSPVVSMDSVAIPLAATLNGQMLKSDWIPEGTVSLRSLDANNELTVDGSYRGDTISWQLQGDVSTTLFTDSMDRPLSIESYGSCKALACSISQSTLQVDSLEAKLSGTLSPNLNISGSLEHPLVKNFDDTQSIGVAVSQEAGTGYSVGLSYQDLNVDARLNSQMEIQTVAVKGGLDYQDAQINRYIVETQDLSWTRFAGYTGTANLNISQQFGTYQVDSSLLLGTIEDSVSLSGPIYINQQVIAVSNIELRNILPNLNGEAMSIAQQPVIDLSGFFDVDVPFSVLNTNLPASLGNLKTRLNIVNVFSEPGADTSLFGFALPYSLIGSIESLAGVATTGSLTLDLQEGAKLDVVTQGIEGLKLSAKVNDKSWQLDADVVELGLTPEVLTLIPLAQEDFLTVNNLLRELREDIVVDADIALKQAWGEQLQVVENKVELQTGSSRFAGNLKLSETVSLQGQLNLNGQDLTRSLPLTIAGEIKVNNANQIEVVNALSLDSDLVETLNLSGSLWPLSLYIQSPQSILDADYLYLSQQNQEVVAKGSLNAKLKVVDDTYVNLTSTEQILNASLVWRDLEVQTVLPTTLSELSQISQETLPLNLSGYLGADNQKPVRAQFRVVDNIVNIDSLNIEDTYGTLNLSGTVDLKDATALMTQFNSLEESLEIIEMQLTGFVEPNWVAVAEQVALPEELNTSLTVLPLTASLQQSQLSLSSTSEFGVLSVQTSVGLTEARLDAALDISGIRINGQAFATSTQALSENAGLNSLQVSGEFDYQGLVLTYLGETVDVSGQASLLPAGLVATGTLNALEQTAAYRADIGWQAIAKRLVGDVLSESGQVGPEVWSLQLLKRLPEATVQEDIRIDVVDFSAQSITPLQRVLPYFSPKLDGTILIQNEVLNATFKSELLTGQRELPVEISLTGLLQDAVLSEASVKLLIDESPARATVDFKLQERVLDGRISLEYFPLQTLLGIVPEESQAFENLQGLEPFTAGFTENTNNLSKLDLRVTGVGTAYVPIDQIQQSQILLVAEQVIFEHESFVRQDGDVIPEALRTQGQLTLRYEQEALNIEQAQFQSYRVQDQSLAGSWSASGQIAEDRLSVNLSAQAADLSPFILLSPSLTDLDILAKGNFNISAQGSLQVPVLFFSSNQFEADIGGGYVESEDVSFLLENGILKGRARLSVARPWQSDIEVEFNGPVQLWPFDIDNVVTDFRSPSFSTNFFGDFKTISGRIYNQAGTWWLNATGDLDNPFQISGTLKPLSLQFSGDQLNLYSESFFIASSLSDIDLSLSYEMPNLVLRGGVVASQAELITRESVSGRRGSKPQFFERILFNNVLLTAPRNMRFNESFLTAELATELYLGGTLAQPTLDGKAELVEGELRYSGQSFTLSEGVASFDRLQGIYPTISASAYANFDKSQLSSNPESYVLQPSTNQFQVFLNTSGGYTFIESEGRYRLGLEALLSSNAIINPNSPRALTEEDIVSLLALRRITDDTPSGSDNVIGEIVGINVIDTAADIIQGAIGDALGFEGVDILTTNLSSIINDGSSASPDFGVGVRFSGYIDESVFASYELGRFTNPDYSLSNQFDIRYDDIFGLNRLGFNLSSGLNFASGSSDPLIDLNMGLDYEINDTISLSMSGEVSSDDVGLSFGTKFKW